MLNPYRLVRLLLLLLVSASASASEVREDELSLGGISLGQTEKVIIERLGAPKERVATGEGLRLIYDGVTFDLSLDPHFGVYEMSGTGRNACTPSGICPGNRMADIRKRFGQSQVAKRERGTFFEYVAHGTPCWLQLAVRNDIVQSVRVVCQP